MATGADRVLPPVLRPRNCVLSGAAEATTEAYRQRQGDAAEWMARSVTEPRLGTSGIQPKCGLTEYGCGRALAHADIAFVALESGTHAPARGAAVLRDDVWLWRHGDSRGAEAKPIRVALREHFYPPISGWQDTVLFRSRQVSRQAPEGPTAGRRTLDGPVSTRCRPTIG